MKIEIGNFNLQSRENRFDIIELRQVEKVDNETKEKTGEVVTREDIVAYDMKLESAIRYVLDRTINDQEQTVSLLKYIEMYKKEREKITNLLK